MNKEQLAIARKIAEIEGVEYRVDTDAGVKTVSTLKRWVEGNKKCCTWTEYNPFDWSILGPLMLKWEVSIDRPCERVYVTQGWKELEINFSGESEIPQAILECIIKSQEAR